MVCRTAWVASSLIGVDAAVVGFLPQTDTSSSLLQPIGTDKPNGVLYPDKPDVSPYLKPAYTDLDGPKQTNKFWASWAVDHMGNNGGSMPNRIFPSPYTLQFQKAGNSDSGELVVLKGKPDLTLAGNGEITEHLNEPDFKFGVVEGLKGRHKIVKEDLFGVHVEVGAEDGQSCKLRHLVYSGMAFPTAQYTGSCTPKVTAGIENPGDSAIGMVSIEQISAGIFKFVRNFAGQPKEYRVYVMKTNGDFVDSSIGFDKSGTLNATHEGYVRFAFVSEARPNYKEGKEDDALILDNYAPCVVTGMDLEVMDTSPVTFSYVFNTNNNDCEVLHWGYANHNLFLGQDVKVLQDLSHTSSNCKGLMTPLVAKSKLSFQVENADLQKAKDLGFLPPSKVQDDHKSAIKEELAKDWADMSRNWRLSTNKIDHYFSGKGFQKLAMLCLMLREFGQTEDADQCARTVKTAFQCLYMRDKADDSDRDKPCNGENSCNGDLQNCGCFWGARGTHYDTFWGGIVSRLAWNFGLDFGNVVYNDHHYHWGYFITSAAMLVDLLPDMKKDEKFTDFINMFIRDGANPSMEDKYFPRFRAFDWFDMHSWSKGTIPDASGKDLESTSEETNFHYGITMWGKVTDNEKLHQLAATVLTINTAACKEFFVFKLDNKNHPPAFLKFHTVGIFYQNKITRRTHFCDKAECIHGIQMLPLTPALSLVRSGSFAFEEWTDQLSSITMDVLKNRPPFGDLRKWMSILVTGNVALHDPEMAWDMMVNNVTREFIDDGLTRSWAMYWVSAQQASGPWPTPDPTPVPSPGCTSDIGCTQDAFCPGQIPCPSTGWCGCWDPTPEPEPTPEPTPGAGFEEVLLMDDKPVGEGTCPTPAPTPAAPTPAESAAHILSSTCTFTALALLLVTVHH